MRSSIYRGLQQGAATRRNRYLRAAHLYRARLRENLTVARARSWAQWDLEIEGAFFVSDDAIVALVRHICQQRLDFSIRQALYHHREWKKWAARNRLWRAEMDAIDKQYPTG